MNFKTIWSKPYPMFMAAKQVDELPGEFGGLVLCENKKGVFLVRESYNQGTPNIGVYVGDESTPDTKVVKTAFRMGDEDFLNEYFELNQ